LIYTGEQLRAARALARVEQSDLASIASVSVDTIKRLERTSGAVSANVATLGPIVLALEAFGVEFTNGGQPGVKTRMPGDYSDAALALLFDRDHLWFIRGAPNPLPANETTLRRALASARKLQSPSQKVISIRSAGDKIVIPAAQIERLWSMADLL
jgi:transcriptional regulator with XRE-family HTH domain